jgi:hypothetical protein
MRAKMLRGELANGLAVAEDLDAFVAMQHAHDLRIDPRNRRELARPVRLVMWP